MTSGLIPGERVLVSSQFLIDADANLKAAISQLLSGGGIRAAGCRGGDAARGMQHGEMPGSPGAMQGAASGTRPSR